MNEHKLINPSVTFVPAVVTADLTALKEQVHEIVMQYDGWVVDENDIDVAKRTVANLNKTAKALSDKRIEIERELKKPVEQFAKEMKELTTLLNDTSSEIKKQLDTYENERKAEKHNRIITSEHWGNYMAFNDEWLNKSYKWQDIEADLLRQKGLFQNNALMIRTMCERINLSTDKYLEMLVAKREINEIIDQITNDDNIRNQYATVSAQKEQPKSAVTQADTTDTDTYSYTLRFTATRVQLKLLREFIDNNGIQYEKVE